MRKFLFLILLFFSHQAFSLDFVFISVYGGGRYPNADSACQATTDAMGSEYTYKNYVISDSSNYNCLYSYRGNNTLQRGGYINGDTCPPPTVAKPDGSGCYKDENKCESKIGQTTFFATDVMTFESCMDSCTVAVTDSVAFATAANGKVSYSAQAVFTGEQCSSSDAGTSQTSAPPPKSSDTAQDCTPTTTDASGNQTSSCTTKTTDIDNQGCVAGGGSVGQINGVTSCVAASKGPKATETTKTVEQTTTKNPTTNASTTNTATTTTEKTCKGTVCTTTTTTVTDSKTTNADGTPASSSSTCTGAKCGTDGKAEEGDGEDEKEEEEETIDGPTRSLGQGEQGNFDEANSEYDAKIETIKTDLDAKVTEYKDLFAKKFDLDLSASGGELMCENIPINFGRFGSTSVRFCPRDYSEQLAYIRYALLLGASVLAAMIIL